MASERDLFRLGMRRVSGTVTVVTTTGPDGERRGVTATAFCSLSADPPSVLACINRETWVGQLAPVSGNFCVNVLSADQQDVAETFAGRVGLAAGERFAVGRWHQGTSGAPVLEGALVSFDCRLDKAVDHATHVILIGHVITTVTEEDPGDALIYADGHFTRPAAPLPMAASA